LTQLSPEMLSGIACFYVEELKEWALQCRFEFRAKKNPLMPPVSGDLAHPHEAILVCGIRKF
jgi:hypothetical protein